MGFDIERLCGYVNFIDAEGIDQHEKFIEYIMDCKLHQREKDCTDPLEINQDSEEPYTIWTHLARLVFYSARNKKVNRYVRIDELRHSLKMGLPGYDDIDTLIDAYLDEERRKVSNSVEANSNIENVTEDVSEKFSNLLQKAKNNLEEQAKEYDISHPKELVRYSTGCTMPEEYTRALKKLRTILNSLHTEETLLELKGRKAEEKCQWIADRCRTYLLQDREWEKIYTEIENSDEAFVRYYPFFRLDLGNSDSVRICTAMLINDELYEYSGTLVEEQ